MTKVLIKSDKITLSGGIFSIIDHFNRNMTSIIDKTLGLRCKTFGYQYSEYAITRSSPRMISISLSLD